MKQEPSAGLRRYAPDALSLCRLALVPPSAALIVEYLTEGTRLWLLLAVFAAVVATDVLDGRLARRLGCATRAGAAIDVVADIAFAVLGAAAVAAGGLAPWAYAAVMAVVACEFFLTSWSASRGSGPRIVYDPFGKASGILSMAYPITIVVIAWWGFPQWFILALGYAMTGLVLAAFCARCASYLGGGLSGGEGESPLVPAHEVDEDGDRLARPVREAVLDADGRLGVHLPEDQALRLQLLEAAREDRARDAAHLGLDVVEAHAVRVGQGYDDLHGPLAGQDAGELQRRYELLGGHALLSLDVVGAAFSRHACRNAY